MPMDIVSGTEVQTQASGVKIDPSAFRRQAIAKGQVVSAAGQDAATLFSQVGNKLQDIQNTKHLAEADNAVIDFNERQQEEVLKHPNPSEWSSIYKANFKQFQDALMSNPAYGPDVKNRISNMLENSKTATDINIRTAANKRNVTDTGNAIEYGMNKAVNSLGYEGAKAKYYGGLLELKNLGILDDAQYNLRAQEADKTIDEGQFKQAVIVNPIETFKKMQDKNYLSALTGQDRDRAITEARAKAVEKQVTNGDKIQNEIRNTPAYLLDRKKVQESANSGEISQRRADGIINSFRIQDARLETNMLDILKARISTHDFQNDLWPTLFINKLKEDASGLSPKLQTEFITFADSHYKKVIAPQVSEEARVTADLRKAMIEKYKAAQNERLIDIPEVIETSKEVIQGSKSWKNFYQGVTKESTILAASKDTQEAFLALQNKPEEIEKKYGKGVTWDDLTHFINTKQAQDIKKIDSFYSTNNPKRLDPAANTEFYNQLTSKQALEKTTAILKGMNLPTLQDATKAIEEPVVINSEAEYDNLPIGKTFTYKGRTGTKTK